MSSHRGPEVHRSKRLRAAVVALLFSGAGYWLAQITSPASAAPLPRPTPNVVTIVQHDEVPGPTEYLTDTVTKTVTRPVTKTLPAVTVTKVVTVIRTVTVTPTTEPPTPTP